MADNINNEVNENKNVKVILDDSLKEIMHMAEKQAKLTPKQLEKLVKEAKDTLDFLNKIDEITLKSDSHVIFTDGNEQLVYENGEFFLESTIDSTKQRKKKKKSEAKDMYLEYFMKYKLNYLIKKREQNQSVKSIDKTINKSKQVQQNTKIKKEINKVPQKETKTKNQNITR